MPKPRKQQSEPDAPGVEPGEPVLTLAGAIADHVPASILAELAGADPHIGDIENAEPLELVKALLRGFVQSVAVVEQPAEPTEGERMLANSRVTSRDLEQWFTYHTPTAEQVELIKRIRQAGGAFAQIVKNSTPGCEDQRQAIVHIRLAVMLANASMVCGVR